MCTLRESEARRSDVESTSSRLFLRPASNGPLVLDHRSRDDSFILNLPALNAAFVANPALFNDFLFNFTFALLGWPNIALIWSGVQV